MQVQVTASDDSGVSRVGLYVRGRGSSGDGVFVGSASPEPFVVSWFTPGFPDWRRTTCRQYHHIIRTKTYRSSIPE